jgi:hypothetical protein
MIKKIFGSYGIYNMIYKNMKILFGDNEKFIFFFEYDIGGVTEIDYYYFDLKNNLLYEKRKSDGSERKWAIDDDHISAQHNILIDTKKYFDILDYYINKNS